MFRRLGGGHPTLQKPKNPHSLEYLKYLHGVLEKNSKVTENNKEILVEALQRISEILIWGDQNDSTVFDFFLERSMLLHFLTFMKQDSGSSICRQLLQTLNILFENIRHETSLYYLLSNNHVNSIVTHKFNLKNEEIMAYYISFMKTLSFKLNAATINFFFNEATGEFPLLTESLKLFDWNESMVRIAVRTIFLNILRVDDESTKKFVRDAAKDYLKEVVDQLVGAAIDLDSFVRSAENVPANRGRLREKADELVDAFHYVGEVLSVGGMDDLDRLIRSRFLLPLLLNSLAPRRDDHSVLLSPVAALFLTAQFIQVVAYGPVLETLLTVLLFEDLSVLTSHWVRSADSYCLKTAPLPEKTSSERVFFEALLSAFDMSKNDDYLAFFALYVVYAIFENKGDLDDLLLAARIPYKSRRPQKSDADLAAASVPVVARECDPRLLSALRALIISASRGSTRLRGVTMHLACLVLRHFVLALDDNHVHAQVTITAEETKRTLVQRMSPSAFSESLFIDMFDDEFAEIENEKLRLDVLSHELLLPPSNSPLSGLSLNKRIPSGREETIRATIQHYLHVRKLEKDMKDEEEDQLPVRVRQQAVVAVGDCINLINSDLLSCTVVLSKTERQSRFLVTDGVDLILVEPDARKAGWAVVTFVGLLQDTQITGEPTDSRALHVVVEAGAGRSRRRTPLLSAKLIFDDHIRCMAAKQRLTKGRQAARAEKLNRLCDVLGIRRASEPSRGNPFKVANGCAPGSVRKEQPRVTDEAGSVPDDPAPGTGGIQHV